MNSLRTPLLILLVTAVFCGIWSVALRVLPKPALAETNYEANRLRVERWLLGPPAPAVLVGSSMSGRLLPDYFEGTSLKGLANLGLDGASPDTGLRLVLMRDKTPPLVLLEAHLLAMRPGPNDRQLIELASGIGLQVSAHLPLTRADARPSTVLYGWLKERRGGGEGSGTAADSPESFEARILTPAEAAKEAAAVDPDWRPRIRSLVAKLQERGSRVILIRLPAGRNNPRTPESSDELAVMAGELDLPMVDLWRISRRENVAVSYSDGLHLTPRAARAVSELLARTLDKAGWATP